MPTFDGKWVPADQYDTLVAEATAKALAQKTLSEEKATQREVLVAELARAEKEAAGAVSGTTIASLLRDTARRALEKFDRENAK